MLSQRPTRRPWAGGRDCQLPLPGLHCSRESRNQGCHRESQYSASSVLLGPTRKNHSLRSHHKSQSEKNPRRSGPCLPITLNRNQGGLGGLCKPLCSRLVLAPSLLCGLSQRRSGAIEPICQKVGEQEGGCEPLLHGGSGFQRGFCSRTEIQMLGATDFPRPRATLLRRPIASFDCGAMFGILLSDEKGSVPNGVILERPTCWTLSPI